MGIKMDEKAKLNIRIPDYTLGEEVFNSISHGIGAGLGVAGLILMVIKASTPLQKTATALFGAAMILLYAMSCLYHAIPPKLEGKKVLRVIDHCNVFLLVFGTYIPVTLIGVGGWLGWTLFGIVAFVTVVGIILTALNVDKYQAAAVACHLVNGWSIVIGVPKLLSSVGARGLFFVLLGGVIYSAGSILYAIGSKKRCMHCVFHIFCILGTICHFWAIYEYLI